MNDCFFIHVRVIFVYCFAEFLPSLRSADDVTVDCWWRHNKQPVLTRAREKWYPNL